MTLLSIITAGDGEDAFDSFETEGEFGLILGSLGLHLSHSCCACSMGLAGYLRLSSLNIYRKNIKIISP